jgi:hypothetical protein
METRPALHKAGSFVPGFGEVGSGCGNAAGEGESNRLPYHLPPKVNSVLAKLRAGLSRNANGGAMFPVIETTICPIAVEGAGRIGLCSFSMRLAVYEQAFVRESPKTRTPRPLGRLSASWPS